MPTSNARQLASENHELRQQNRRLKERIALVVMQLRHHADSALAALGDLERGVTDDPEPLAATG